MVLIEKYGKEIRLSESATRRLARANRSGGDRYRDWCQLNDAIAKELVRRESKPDPPARANLEKSAQAPVLKYPVQYAKDVKRIERELAAEEHGGRKPMVNEKLRTAVTVAYQSNELAKAKRIQDQLDWKMAHERVKRRAKKARKLLLQHCHARMDARPRGFDPNSDDDQAGNA